MSAVLSQAATELGVRLSVKQKDAFDRYADLLLSDGRRAGVTAIVTRESVERRHFVESLAVAKALLDADILREGEPLRVIDVGTGGGFPGLPMRLLLPRLRLTLLDARERTTAFLRDLLQVLGIDDVEVITARAEDAPRDAGYREQFDLALARAVAPLPVLLELTLPFLRVGGHLATLKGSRSQGEMARSEKALKVLGGAILSGDPLRLPGGVQPQRLVVVRKLSPTPSRYPRKAGIPKKRPL